MIEASLQDGRRLAVIFGCAQHNDDISGLRLVKRGLRGKRCTRYVKLSGSFSRPLGKAGAGTFSFSGRLSGHPLAPGRYRWRLQVSDDEFTEGFQVRAR